MTRPMDPHNIVAGESEYSYGPGLFPPGIANGEGQSSFQDDFGILRSVPGAGKAGDIDDNYARAVADRRTDSTDPDSGRDFTTYGNPDRFGPNPPLITAQPVSSAMSPEAVQAHKVKRQPLKRAK